MDGSPPVGSEERFRTLVDQFSDSYFAFDEDGIIVDANQQACDSLGYRRDELVGMSARNVVASLPLDDELGSIRDRLGAGDALTVHAFHRRKDGTTFPVETRILPIHLNGHTRAVCLARDVTERRRTENELRASEARYRAVVDDQTEFIVRWLPDGTRTFVNDAYVRYFGLPREEIIGTSFIALIPIAEERAALARRMAEVTPADPIMHNLHRARRADGEDRWQEWIDRALFDADGRVLEWQSVGRDVHERVEAQQALRDSQMLMRILVEHTPAAVAMFDTEMRYLAWSRRWLTDYGLPERDLTGLTHYEVFPEIGEAWRAVHRRCLLGATEGCEEDRFPRADGTVDYVRWFVQPWHRTGRKIGGVVIFTEVITERIVAAQALRRSEEERRKLEEQVRHAQKMEAIGRLAAGVAHDFNNLLSVIGGYSALLGGDPALSPAAQAMVSEISAAGSRAGRLTAQLLAFSRKQVLQPSIVELGTLVGETSRMLERLIGEHVVLTTSLPPGLWPIRVDAGQLEQVIVNLAVNARDAMPDGGRLIIAGQNLEVSAECPHPVTRLSPGRWVELSVTDTGVGMDLATQERVFEPFFTTKATGKGTGLGLATVYGIVEQSDGIIDLESTVGRGTRFGLYFPAMAPADTSAGAATTTRAPAAPPGTETILVVEDERSLRRLLLTTLRRLGYTVLDVASPEEALNLFAERGESIHLIITDVVMPGMSGGELATYARQLVPDIRVLYMSGHTDDEVIRSGVLRGEVDFLQKPFTPTVLGQRVRAALDR